MFCANHIQNRGLHFGEKIKVKKWRHCNNNIAYSPNRYKITYLIIYWYFGEKIKNVKIWTHKYYYCIFAKLF